MKPSVAKSASDASKGGGPASVSSERGGTVARVLDAAEAVFAESGFAGASVRDIASRAGLNAASLYNYYPGKQELYEAVLDRALFPILDMLGGLAGTAAADDTSLDVVDVVVDHIARRPAIARILHYEALAGGESIARLVGRWIAPIYSSGVEALRRSEAAEVWTADELPLLIESLHNVIVGTSRWRLCSSDRRRRSIVRASPGTQESVLEEVRRALGTQSPVTRPNAREW
jgi:AcrR family transcriptional regulator